MKHHALKFALLAAAAAAAAVAIASFPRPALADDITVDTTPFVSQARRAEVRAQLSAGVAALRAGDWVPEATRAAQVSSARTVQQSREEYVRARGEVSSLTGEDSGSFSMLKMTPADAAASRAMGAPGR